MQVSCKSKKQTYAQWKWPKTALQCKQTLHNSFSHCL